MSAGVNYVLTRYLEKINNIVPRIAEKISEDSKRTQLNQKEKNILLQKNDICFYCKEEYSRYHMEHVIPFNFVYDTKL